jgi:regulator of protease activity HflC (stomatin/prohibitin superfamily)
MRSIEVLLEKAASVSKKGKNTVASNPASLEKKRQASSAMNQATMHLASEDPVMTAWYAGRASLENSERKTAEAMLAGAVELHASLCAKEKAAYAELEALAEEQAKTIADFEAQIKKADSAAFALHRKQTLDAEKQRLASASAQPATPIDT